jgi:hypothetical protein
MVAIIVALFKKIVNNLSIYLTVIFQSRPKINVFSLPKHIRDKFQIKKMNLLNNLSVFYGVVEAVNTEFCFKQQKC